MPNIQSRRFAINNQCRIVRECTYFECTRKGNHSIVIDAEIYQSTMNNMRWNHQHFISLYAL